jgi:hypothetical protein
VDAKDIALVCCAKRSLISLLVTTTRLHLKLSWKKYHAKILLLFLSVIYFDITYFFAIIQGILSYVYCSTCNLAWPGWDCCVNNHPNHEGEPVPFPGVYVQVIMQVLKHVR